MRSTATKLKLREAMIRASTFAIPCIAAAFVDVMRNLVELEGYQLLISSHKRDEGEFIARKFNAAGLPCIVVEFVGASKDCVRIERPRHNAAARRLLAEPQAKLA